MRNEWGQRAVRRAAGNPPKQMGEIKPQPQEAGEYKSRDPYCSRMSSKNDMTRSVSLVPQLIKHPLRSY